MLAKTADISRLEWGRIPSHTLYRAAGSPEVLVGCWLGNVNFLPCRRLLRALYSMAAGFPQSRRWPPGYGVCILISEVTSHHFCRVLFIRSESTSPFHTEGVGVGGILHRLEYQEAGVAGGHLGGCLPHSLFSLQSHWPISQLLLMA